MRRLTSEKAVYASVVKSMSGTGKRTTTINPATGCR